MRMSGDRIGGAALELLPEDFRSAAEALQKTPRDRRGGSGGGSRIGFV